MADTPGARRLRATLRKRNFSTPNRKARFIAPEKPALRETTSAEYPLRLNTGRLRDQWHSMTRSGQSPKLGAHKPEPFLEIHPLDAKAHGLSNNGFAQIHSRLGACTLKVVTSAAQQRGSVFAPIHWSDANASSARIGDLVRAQNDPFSGQPEAKATPVAVASVELRLSRVYAGPRGTRHAERNVVGARRAGRCRRHTVCDERRADGLARPRA